ncbi:hypothetical protein Hypma_004908 [Hypsizygus marmoreus]|uniref:Uncharacterized protein n=1 Tax=Hypsizygus marmoreus TaxID=39966 RepID=A0A369KBG7_HYPMA|nr:hypothetical protein Hypma_004908 [Hypsizygus marmoreus]
MAGERGLKSYGLPGLQGELSHVHVIPKRVELMHTQIGTYFIQEAKHLDFSALLKLTMSNTEAEQLTLEDDLGYVEEDPNPLKRPASPSSSHSDQAPYLSHRHAKQNKKRAMEKAQHNHVPSLRILEEYVQLSEPIESHLVTKSLPATKGAYRALNERYDKDARKEFTLEELLHENGFTLIEWDGRDPVPIRDRHGLVIAVLGGRPADISYVQDADAIYYAIMSEGQHAKFSAKASQSRKGAFAALNVGVSYGNGQERPSRLNTGKHAAMLERLVSNPALQRIAAFQSAVFQLWAPRIFAYYDAHLKRLYEKLLHLTRLFPRSIFPCSAFNFGGNVISYKHRDVLNCPFGWCAIQALGKFNPKRGGHSVLWELKLIIEFPHASSILIPSAVITHSNLPIQPGESRVSFTQYCAGGIFQWVDNGFRTEPELYAEDPDEYEQMQAKKDARWEEGLSLFSTMEEIFAQNID